MPTGASAQSVAADPASSGPDGLLSSEPENRTGAAAYVIDPLVAGATYTIKVSNYNPGFSASYTLNLS